MAKENQSYETSALSNILNAGAKGAASPSIGAKIGGDIIAPPGAGDTAAQVLQAGVNMAIAGSKEFMGVTVRQHGRSPSAVLQDLNIQQSINTQKPVTPVNQSTVNKGIEAARQKTATNKSGKVTSQSANKGITSYQSKTSGKFASASKSNASNVSKAVSAESSNSSTKGQGR